MFCNIRIFIMEENYHSGKCKDKNTKNNFRPENALSYTQSLNTFPLLQESFKKLAQLQEICVDYQSLLLITSSIIKHGRILKYRNK